MAFSVNNTNTLLLLNVLNRTSAEQARSVQRLSTGRRINGGRDDPAGLIAIQSLDGELTATEAALGSAQRANSFLGVADGAVKEISSLLSQVESLAAASSSSGGLSASEIAANQAQIDSAIESIDRIVRTTTFNGTHILDGTQSIRSSASQSSKVADVRVYSRRSSSSSDTLAVNVDVAGTVASATLYAGTSVSAASISIAGALGTATIDIADSETVASIRDKIIAAASQTGVSASVSSGQVHLQSREFGDSAFLSVSHISGDSDFGNVSQTTGSDAQVTVGGQTGFVDGLHVSFNTGGVSGEFTLTSSGNVAGSAGNITVSGGGATFQLGTDANSRSTLGIESLASHKLGDANLGYLNTLKSGGANDLSSDPANAVAVARKAIEVVATSQGRIGAFQKYQVDTSINSLSATQAALKDAIGTINDVDFASETANLNRLNVLIQSGTSLLGLANQQAGQILSLLR